MTPVIPPTPRRPVRRAVIAAGIVAAVALTAIVVGSIALNTTGSSAGSVSTSAGSSGAGIRGLKTFHNTADHVQGPVTYPQSPPAGGPHNPAWLDCGIYSQPVPNENAVHDLEHGAVWVTYDPALPAAELAKLRDLMPSTYAVLSPYPGLRATIVLSAWNAQVRVTSVSDSRIPAFFERYWKSATAPEPGAPCTGGLDAPGKL